MSPGTKGNMNTINGKWEEKEINLVMSELSQRLLFLQETLSLWKPHLLLADTGGCPPKHNLNQEALCDKQRPIDETHPVLQVIAEMYEGFLDGSAAKEPTCMWETDTGDLGSICGSGRSPGGGNGNPLQ